MPCEGVFRVSVLTVNLAENSYEIVIERGALALLGPRCRALGLKGVAAVISNPTVAALYGSAVRESLEAAGFTVAQIEIPDGEEYKNSATLNQLYDDLLAAGADRGSFAVALGGGVVGDVAGYAAATWMRGIPFTGSYHSFSPGGQQCRRQDGHRSPQG